MWIDRKSTRLNSSHLVISYAVFCLKKKNNRSPQTLSVFFLFGEGCGDPLFLLPGWVAVLFSCVGGARTNQGRLCSALLRVFPGTVCRGNPRAPCTGCDAHNQNTFRDPEKQKPPRPESG